VLPKTVPNRRHALFLASLFAVVLLLLVWFIVR
jgi:hypothetical protein